MTEHDSIPMSSWWHPANSVTPANDLDAVMDPRNGHFARALACRRELHTYAPQRTHIAFLCHDAYVGPTVEAAMQNTQWHHASKDENFDTDATTPSGFLADRFGVRLSLLLLFVGLVIATAQVLSQPSFEKCSAIRPFADRIACYESLRNEYLKPPVK
jgi:hypothetical protein